MAEYFEEMGWTPLEEGQTPNHTMHLARLLRDYNLFEEMGMNVDLPPPTAKKIMDELPTIVIDKDGKKCPVCLKEHEKDETVKELPCTHEFHTECIIPWLTKTNSCPLCRYELETDDENYEAYRKEKIRAKQRPADIENLHNSMFS